MPFSDARPIYAEDDLGHPGLCERDADLMRALEGQRLQYARAHFAGPNEQGVNFGERAHGLRKALAIAWRWMTQPDARLDDPVDTMPMPLE